LLRSLADEGRTVFVSSHVLAEVEQTCDAVAILRRGRCVAQGKVADVVARAAGDNAMIVKLADLEAGCDVLRRAGLSVERRNGHLRVGIAAADAARITETLASRRLWVSELHAEERSLEDLFLELTTDDMTQEVAP
jgi:ABC-2 type transport system ATP-binding protein